MTRAALADVSRYQSMIDGMKIRAAGFCGIVARCTIGFSEDGSSAGRSLDFYHNSQKQARENGMIFGGYHVLWPANKNPLREADSFLAKCGPVDLAVLDVELDHGLTKAVIQAQAKIWLERVTTVLQKKVFVYSASWWWTVAAGWENTYPLWEAEYIFSAPRGGIDISQQPEAPKKPDTLSKGWTDWALWQWTSGGKPVGAQSESMDYNVVNNSEDQFRQFLGLGSAPPPPLPSPKVPVEIRAPAGTIDVTVTET
jgi:GH25 family lysozyme M1 (1,4-beta-N-acetylmuramidase)